MKIAFIDRDGTLIWEPPETKQVDSREKLRILPGVVRGLRTLQERGYQLVLVTNQDGIGTDSFPEESFQVPQQEFLHRLESEGIRFNEVFVCPHTAADACDCRKPKTGLVADFVSANPPEPGSLMIGDRETDREFGERLGLYTLKMRTNGPFPRFGLSRRRTRETEIEVFVNLDGSGRVEVETGIGFFDHMLDALCHHGGMDVELRADGDLHVDTHHTIEDTALVLGAAIRKAVGDAAGIERFGAWVPMDEALAHAVVDLSGRPYLVFEGEFEREKVGEMPTELVEHFFYSLSQTLACNLHLELVRGKNDHHKIEALFKGTGRALRQAFRRDGDRVPSTKGVL